MIPYEDKVDVFPPINILFIGDRGLQFLIPHEDRGWRILIPHGDIVDVTIYPNQHIVQSGWQILIPHEDKVDVITPINMLFRGGGEFRTLMKIKLMLLPQSTYCSEGVANFNEMMIMMMMMMTMMMMMMMRMMMMMMMMVMMVVVVVVMMTIMTIESVEQRPGLGEHV